MPAIQSEIRFFPVPVAEAIRPEDVENVQSGDYIASLLRSAGVEIEDQDVIAISSKVAAFLDSVRRPSNFHLTRHQVDQDFLPAHEFQVSR